MQAVTYEEWRVRAREMLVQGVRPKVGRWETSQVSLFETDQRLTPIKSPKVPAEFLQMARYVAAARDENRWDLLYRLLYRLNHENSHLLKVTVDSDVHRMNLLCKSVRRDIHKMHAFVRFKRAVVEGVETYVAWHKPEHYIIELGAPFFVRRFGDKPWSIFSPDGSAHWNLQKLILGPGMSQQDFHHEDPFDDVWKTYYKSIFNPARVKIKMMKTEMAPKYWSALPEAEIIQELIRDTPRQLQNMREAINDVASPPMNADWPQLKAAAMACTSCPLAAHATQTVFGEGRLQAEIMIVGEQPGDAEDLVGKNFIGSAGEILNQALSEVGLRRQDLYITNVVKHFKYEPQGARRLHKKASGREMHACKPWLEAEIALIKPKVILCLGVTASTAVYGKLLNVQKERGVPYTESGFAPNLLVSWHPSAILRSSSEAEKQTRFQDLVSDLQMALELSRITG